MPEQPSAATPEATASAGEAGEERPPHSGLPPGGLGPELLDRLTDVVYDLLRDDLRRQRERGGIGRWR